MNNDFDGMNSEIVGDLHEFPNGRRLICVQHLPIDWPWGYLVPVFSKSTVLELFNMAGWERWNSHWKKEPVLRGFWRQLF